MKKSFSEKKRRPWSMGRKVLLGIVGAAVFFVMCWLMWYYVRYVNYDRYKDYLTSYGYEEGSAFTPLQDSDVEGMDLVCENDFLKLYTDTASANIAVYDKRNGSVTFANPPNADNDSIANKSNINYLKSQFILTYYNADVKSGTYDSYSQSVAKGQYTVENITDGIRYIYQVGELSNRDGTEGIYFEIPLEYRLKGDGLEVSIPVSAIKEYGNGSVARIQLLRYMGAADNTEEGYIVVPNGSGSLIRFNNGKVSAAAYSQYIYGIDPLAANYTTTENMEAVKLSLFGICRQDRGLLVTVEKGASTASLTANVSGVYNDYNYAFPTFVLRNADNLRMFGDASQDVYVLEQDAYDINLTVRYTFLTDENSGYEGLARYYRKRLIEEGVLTRNSTESDIPFYYDIIAAGKESSHFLGVQYLHTFEVTTFDEAGKISEDLAACGVNKQVMNLQGWFNGGYYHDTADKINVPAKLGGKSGLKKLQEKLNANGGRLYLDVAFQEVTFADKGFNYSAESSRYYGAGYVASFGLVDPTSLRNTSNLGYSERSYDLLSPKFLPRYVGAFAKKMESYEVDGISLRDLGNKLHSDKKRTNVISREQALEVVTGQLGVLAATGKQLLTNGANDYSFGYSTDIINVPVDGNAFSITDEDIPLYEMILHGYISYSSKLLNYQDEEDMTGIILQLIETGTSPHYVFTWDSSNVMKDTGLNGHYATTYETWKAEAVSVYHQVNDALKHVSGAVMVGHEIMDNGVRKVTYDNGVTIYVNYSREARTVDGLEVPAMWYRLEGI